MLRTEIDFFFLGWICIGFSKILKVINHITYCWWYNRCVAQLHITYESIEFIKSEMLQVSGW